jgi:hypothetical protein
VEHSEHWNTELRRFREGREMPAGASRFATSGSCMKKAQDGSRRGHCR